MNIYIQRDRYTNKQTNKQLDRKQDTNLTRVAMVCPIDPRARRYPKPRDLSSMGITWAYMWKMVGRPEVGQVWWGWSLWGYYWVRVCEEAWGVWWEGYWNEVCGKLKWVVKVWWNLGGVFKGIIGKVLLVCSSWRCYWGLWDAMKSSTSHVCFEMMGWTINVGW